MDTLSVALDIQQRLEEYGFTNFQNQHKVVGGNQK